MPRRRLNRASQRRPVKRSAPALSLRRTEKRTVAPNDELVAWNNLVANHGERPGTDQDAVYCLPEGLIRAIETNVPNLWAAEDVAFEVDLARLGGTGFFHRRQVGAAFVPGAAPAPITGARALKLTERNQKSAHLINKLIAKDMRGKGYTELEIQARFNLRTPLELTLLERKQAYVGWLVASKGFRREIGTLRDRWSHWIERDGYFPEFPIATFGRGPSVPKRIRPLYGDFMILYQRWGLETLLTWDIPVPLDPQLGINLYESIMSPAAGMVLFVPWYLMRDKDIRLSDVAAGKRTSAVDGDLEQWISGVPKNWGRKRYRQMLALFVYQELALRRRYGTRLKRVQGRLDSAFARFFGEAQIGKGGELTSDTVKRTQTQLRRRLAPD